MEQDRYENRFRSIERKLNLLIAIVTILLVISLFIVVKLFLPSTFTLILMLLALAVFLFIFRNQIPGWFGNASRYFFYQLVSAQKSDSMKDIK